VSNTINTASEVTETVPAVYNKMVSKLSDSGIDLITKVPLYTSIKSTMYRRRNKEAKVNKMSFSNVSEVEVPEKFQNFLLADYNYDGLRILAFCTEEAIKQIITIKIFLSDGTFYSCPHPFSQLYTIHGDIGSTQETTNIVPLIYVLLSEKSANIYMTMFSIITSALSIRISKIDATLNWNWNPEIFLTDFEQASIKAIKSTFPQVNHHGCFFHFTRALRKKARKLRLTSHDRVKRIVTLTTKLPLLPENKIVEGWSYIKAQADKVMLNCSSIAGNLNKFIWYFEKFWMREHLIKSWSSFGHRHRTTNFLEGWHYKFRSLFKSKPKTLNIFLNNMKDDAAFYTVHCRRVKFHASYSKKRKPLSIENDIMIIDSQMQLLSEQISVPLFLEQLR
jgi:hypothetical protein